MAFSVRNPSFSIPNTPNLLADDQLEERMPGLKDTAMSTVCKAKVSLNCCGVLSKEEISSRKRKEREGGPGYSLEGGPTQKKVGLVNRSVFLQSYVPFYKYGPSTNCPTPPVSLSDLKAIESRGLKFSQPSLINPDAQQMVSVSLVPTSNASSASSESSESSSSVSGKKTSSHYSLRKERTPNCRLRPIGNPEPLANRKDGIVELFEQQGIKYVADVQIDPKYQSAISAIFNGIPDDEQSDDADPEGKACSHCIQTMKDDGSDKYASAIEAREVIFTREDGLKVEEKGVFANRQIKKDDVIGIYAGDLVPLDTYKEGDKDYVFEFSEDAFQGWGVDAKNRGNFTRYINHCKEEDENVNAVGFYDGNVPRIIFIATKTIPKGSQLMYDYGDDYWERKGIVPSGF